MQFDEKAMLNEISEVLKRHLGCEYVEALSVDVSEPSRENKVRNEYGRTLVRSHVPVTITLTADTVRVRACPY